MQKDQQEILSLARCLGNFTMIPPYLNCVATVPCEILISAMPTDALDRTHRKEPPIIKSCLQHYCTRMVGQWHNHTCLCVKAVADPEEGPGGPTPSFTGVTNFSCLIRTFCGSLFILVL